MASRIDGFDNQYIFFVMANRLILLILPSIYLSMTATIISAELLKTAPFAWDTETQTPPPERLVVVDASRAALWGHAILAASAALRCGSRVALLADADNAGALAAALPESTFTDTFPASGAVPCLLQTPEVMPSQPAVIVADPSAALPGSCIGITAQSLENVSVKSTFVGGWPQLKVLLADATSYEIEARSAKDGPQPFVPGSEFVLAGITSALRARGLAPNAAAVWALYLLNLSIEAAAKDVGEGLRAGDLIMRLSGSLRYATRHAAATTPTRSGLRPA